MESLLIFFKDPNLDGAFTISDVWLLGKWLACLPGNLLQRGILEYLPSVSGFFEITDQSQYGTMAWILSSIIWLIVIVYTANST